MKRRTFFGLMAAVVLGYAAPFRREVEWGIISSKTPGSGIKIWYTHKTKVPYSKILGSWNAARGTTTSFENLQVFTTGSKEKSEWTTS